MGQLLRPNCWERVVSPFHLHSYPDESHTTVKFVSGLKHACRKVAIFISQRERVNMPPFHSYSPNLNHSSHLGIDTRIIYNLL